MNNNLFLSYANELEELNKVGMLRSIPNINTDGKYIYENGEKFLNLSSNDYLGIFEREDIKSRFLDYINNFPSKYPLLSSASSRLLTGNSNSYADLEKLLASKFGKESALLFNSGYHANNGILPALTDKNSLIVADKLVHASIIDGIKLSGCKFERFKHNNVKHLAKILEKEHSNYQKIFIVTEGVFSMRGDSAPLREIVEIKNKYDNVLLYLDEAHSFGVLGSNGLGLADELNLIDSVDLYVATFGKAISSVGAFLVCNNIVRSYLINKMRPLIFSTALPSINVEWSKYIINELDSFSKDRENLKAISLKLKDALGINDTSNSNILSYVTGSAESAVIMHNKLKANGVYALPVRPPTVSEGERGIRISLTSAINEQDLVLIITAFNS